MVIFNSVNCVYVKCMFMTLLYVMFEVKKQICNTVLLHDYFILPKEKKTRLHTCVI